LIALGIEKYLAFCTERKYVLTNQLNDKWRSRGPLEEELGGSLLLVVA